MSNSEVELGAVRTVVTERGRRSRWGWRPGAAWMQVVVLLVLLGCNKATPQPPSPGPRSIEDGRTSMQKTLAGHLTLDAGPWAGVDVSLIRSGGQVIATAKTDRQGDFSLAKPDDFKEGWVLAKLREPIVGAVVSRVTDPTKPVALAVSSKATMTLSVEIQLPEGAQADWFDVALDPRAFPGIPSELTGKPLYLVGTGPSMSGKYYTVRTHEPRLSLRVLVGTYDVSVQHIVERSPTVFPGPPNWTSDTLTLPDGTKLPEALGRHRIEVGKDLQVKVLLRVFKE